MSVSFLQQRYDTLKSDFKKKSAEYQHLREQLEDVKTQLKEAQKEKRLEDFYAKYGEQAEIVVEKYESKVRSRMKQGTYGYKVWVQLEAYQDAYHFLILEEDYQYCLPSPEEMDAYYAVHGKELRVTKSKHRERWGN